MGISLRQRSQTQIYACHISMKKELKKAKMSLRATLGGKSALVTHETVVSTIFNGIFDDNAGCINP